MARRISFLAGLERAARAAALAQREAEAAQRRRERDRLRQERETLRLRQQQNKWQRQEYLASRQSEADTLNADVVAQIQELHGIMSARLQLTEDSVLECLTLKKEPPVFGVESDLAQPLAPPVKASFTWSIRPMAWWEKLFGQRARFDQEVLAAEQQFQNAWQEYERIECLRQEKVEELRRNHERELSVYRSELENSQREIEALRSHYRAGDIDAVTTYFSTALEKSPYPEGFPQQFRTAYDPAAKQLVVDYELPTVTIVPPVAEHRYVKAKDVIEAKPRKPAEVKELYREIVSAIALRSISECFTADSANQVEVLTFSGYVNTIDPSTGNPIRPYLISVRVTKEGDFVREESNTDDWDWWVAPVSGGRAERTSARNTFEAQGLQRPESANAHHRIVPDGWTSAGYLIFSARLGNQTNIWRLPVSATTGRVNGQAEQLTYGAGREDHPSMTDGGALVFSVLTHKSDVTTSISAWDN